MRNKTMWLASLTIILAANLGLAACSSPASSGASSGAAPTTSGASADSSASDNANSSSSAPTSSSAGQSTDASSNASVTSGASTSSSVTSTPSASASGSALAITLEDDEGLVIECPTSAVAGETVHVAVYDLTDVYLHVAVNEDEDFGKLTYGYEYVFVMPDEPVTVRAWSSSDGIAGA